jgi:SAM-dependent methyltransferase
MVMEADTIQRLLDLNRQFYQTFALHFSATRQRLQPGVRRILDRLQPPGDGPRSSPRSGLRPPAASLSLLELGCGNGELARELAERGFHGNYVGIDQTSQFLEIASESLKDRPDFLFLECDLSRTEWDAQLPLSVYDAILAFAVLHHLPGESIRQAVLEIARARLLPGGLFFISAWQPLNSPRLRSRLRPWKAAGLSEDEVDPGDVLIDWRRGGEGLRYVHVFSQDELSQLGTSTGFAVQETFFSDGEGDRLGIYQIWKVV